MPDPKAKAALSRAERDALLHTLRDRFEKHMHRHPGLTWEQVEAKLTAQPARLWSLHQMETTGGEPDVIGHERKGDVYLFADFSPQSPAGRTSLCYDRAALDSRKEAKPKNSVVDLAAAMGVELLTEAQYHELQQLGEFDTKTSSWLLTPPELRQRGGALFGDRRYGRVFVYHNGAQSYYSVRGFRARLPV